MKVTFRILIAVLVLSGIGIQNSSLSTTVDAQDDGKLVEARVAKFGISAKTNTKKSATAALKILSAERDSVAGKSMSDSSVLMTSKAAHDVIKKTLKKWTSGEQLFPAFWLLRGLLLQKTAEADEVVSKLVKDSKSDYLKSAGLQAIAEVHRSNLVGVYVEELSDWKGKKWHIKHSMLALTMASNIHRIVDKKNKASRDALILAVADVLDFLPESRVGWFFAQSLAKATGAKATDSAKYWRFWVAVGGNVGDNSDKPEDRKTYAGEGPPEFFGAKAVGKRIIIIIDISGSMAGEIALPDEMMKKKKSTPVTGRRSKKDKEEKDEGPDYSNVKTKLDLAKVELVYTISKLSDDYFFNIVVYGSDHRVINASHTGFVPANKANKAKYIKAAKAIGISGATNIHGALKRAFGLNDVKPVDPISPNGSDAAWDKNCFLSGATTIFFLTDGSPSHSDSSRKVDSGMKDQNGNPLLSDYYAVPNNILEDIRRINLFRKVVIHTVGIGYHGKALLEGLAKDSFGNYVDKTFKRPEPK